MPWSEIITGLAALIGAIAGGAALVQKRKQPKIDDATADKIKAEIEKDQAAARRESAAANARRDLHVIRLEKWGFELVRPWGRKAATIVDEQNELLVELAARAGIEYHPKTLAPFPEMPQIDDL